MSEDFNTPTPIRAMRRQGQRMNAKERKAAQEKFLKSFSMTANVRAACLNAGIDRSMVYYWQEHDTEFSLQFNIASEEANDMIRAALWKRGVEGVERRVISMGRVVCEEEPMLDAQGKPVYDAKGKPLMRSGKPIMEREYSDSLLSLLAKARMPEYRDKGLVINNILPKEYHFDPNQDGCEV
jgi:hypothetical protein